jgi:antitoxin FitA
MGLGLFGAERQDHRLCETVEVCEPSALYMCFTWFYVGHMSVMIQIRSVPDALHRRLKSRAALAGMSLSDYLLAELRQIAEWPTVEELRQRLAQRPATNPRPPPEEAVRAERDAE